MTAINGHTSCGKQRIRALIGLQGIFAAPTDKYNKIIHNKLAAVGQRSIKLRQHYTLQQ